MNSGSNFIKKNRTDSPYLHWVCMCVLQVCVFMCCVCVLYMCVVCVFCVCVYICVHICMFCMCMYVCVCVFKEVRKESQRGNVGQVLFFKDLFLFLFVYMYVWGY